MKKVLLYSGGMDSWLISHIWKPDLKVYVNMHTRYSEEELKRIASEPDVVTIDLPLGQWEREDAIIPLRNLYLVMAICNMTGDEDVDICLGATAGDRVLDKSYQFASMATELLNFLYQPQHWIPKGKKVGINLQFKGKTKTELLQEFVEQGGDMNEAFNRSFSCYNPVDGHECWQCKPCFRKFVSFSLCGMKFPEQISRTAINYINKEIKPQIDTGTYGRATEEQEILEVLSRYAK